jgi:hypothetical protein
LAHFFADFLSTVNWPFLLTQPRTAPSEPTKLVAAYAPPPNAKNTATLTITFAYVSLDRILASMAAPSVGPRPPPGAALNRA